MPDDNVFSAYSPKTYASTIALSAATDAIAPARDCTPSAGQTGTAADEWDETVASAPCEDGIRVVDLTAPRPPPKRIADDFVDGIAATTLEIFGADTRVNRRKVYRQLSEVAPELRLRGIIKVAGRVCCIPSMVRADLARRAREAVQPKQTGTNGTGVEVSDEARASAAIAPTPRHRGRPRKLPPTEPQNNRLLSTNSAMQSAE